jgi:hypothetical protein
MILAILALLACKRTGAIVPENDVRNAEMIVRVTALDYDKQPPDDHTLGTVRFRVEEVIKGRREAADLTLPARLDGSDDFNDVPVPYHLVRPSGRTGNCGSDQYRRGASYLLLLKSNTGAWTPHWDALAPLNEQIHGKDDPWVVWVRKQAGGKRR